MAPTLKPYQIDGVDWLRVRDRGFLADEAGLGKSVQLLKGAEGPVVIVAPAMVLESGTWDDEIEKWAPGIDALQVSYSSIAQRGPRGRVERDYNGFPLCPPKPEYLRHLGRGGTLILDECHYVKGRKTNWSVACEQLAKKADKVELATGTPIQNWAEEAYMLLRILHPEEAKPGHDFGSYWRWVGNWFEVTSGFHGGREIGDLRDDRTWEGFREQNWRGAMLRRLREDVLDQLPPLTRQEWRCPMTPEQARAYKKLRSDFVTWLDSGVEVEAWSEPGMLVKLAKIATGLENVDPSIKPGTTGKFKQLLGILEDRPRQTLVLGHFQSTVENCVAVARRTGQTAMAVHGGVPSGQRKEAIRAFQRGQIDVMCASLNTISEGVTLHQGGADQVVFVERSMTPTKNEQAVRRLHRMGVEVPVHCIDLVAPGSLDVKQLKMLAEKTDQQMKALGTAELRDLIS